VVTLICLYLLSHSEVVVIDRRAEDAKTFGLSILRGTWNLQLTFYSSTSLNSSRALISFTGRGLESEVVSWKIGVGLNLFQT
jgi:hypothetical protein